jgi:two-component system chemotaxis sensor kinase CheA
VFFTVSNASDPILNQQPHIEKGVKKKVKFRLAYKITLLTVVIIFGVAAIGSYYLFNMSIQNLHDQVRDKLKMIAANAALSIDAEKLKLITSSEDEGNNIYLELQSKLQQIQKASEGKLRFVYTYARSGPKYYFVLDALPIGAEDHSSVGDPFDVTEFPFARMAFKGATSELKPSYDKDFDVWSQSGYAPIKDSNRNVIGVLGIDMDITTLLNEEKKMNQARDYTVYGTLFLAVLVSLLFARYLTKPISLLTKSTQKIAAGDFNTVVKVKRNDELGLLAQSFNTMTLDLKESHQALQQYNLELEEKVRQRTAELSDINKEIKDILDNISQAIFTIDSNLEFNPQHSKFANSIFGNINFTGNSLLKIFFPLDNQMTERDNLNTWLQKVFCLDSMRNWPSLHALQPVKEIIVKIKNSYGIDSSKYIQIDFQPITNTLPSEDREIVTKVMVIVQDITEKKALELEIEKKEKEYKDNINQIVEIIKMDRELFQDYINECKDHLVEFEPKLIQLKDDRNNMDLINDLFRIMHTIKGNARIFKLERIEGEAHNVESIFNAIRKGERVMDDQLLNECFKRLDRFNTIFNEMLNIYYKISQGKDLDTGKTRSDERLKDESGILKVRVQEIDRLAALIRRADKLIMEDVSPIVASNIGPAKMAEIQNLFEETAKQFKTIRKVAIGKLFARIPRLVRDLSTELGKKVRLNIQGDNIEIDKNIFDKLSDPIIHILRNSLDHGIEKPEERISLGKPEEGTIDLAASLSDSELLVEISDDGQGLDIEKIKAKAVKKGLLTPEKALYVSDQEAINFIFSPGFSTSDQVNAISGRGVGMDVVKIAIEENLKGTVSLSNQKNRGLKVRLAIPLAY